MRKLPWEYAVRNLARSPLRLVLTVGSATLVVLLVIVSHIALGMIDAVPTSRCPAATPRHATLWARAR